MKRVFRRGFTLVEILIVVVILGILSAIVVPQFASATEQAQNVATVDQLNKIRKALSLYYVRSNSEYPNITAGVGTWGELLASQYMREAPSNTWIGTGNSKVIVMGTAADTSFQSTHGWIYNPATGDVWAGSFDAADGAFDRP